MHWRTDLVDQRHDVAGQGAQSIWPTAARPCAGGVAPLVEPQRPVTRRVQKGAHRIPRLRRLREPVQENDDLTVDRALVVDGKGEAVVGELADALSHGSSMSGSSMSWFVDSG